MIIQPNEMVWKRSAVAGCDTVSTVTHKAAECRVIITREWVPPKSSTQQTKYRDDHSSGKGDKQQDQEFCLPGLHLGRVGKNKQDRDNPSSKFNVVTAHLVRHEPQGQHQSDWREI